MDSLLVAAGNPSEWTGPTGNNTWLLMGREPALVDAGTGLATHQQPRIVSRRSRPLGRVAGRDLKWIHLAHEVLEVVSKSSTLVPLVYGTPDS